MKPVHYYIGLVVVVAAAAWWLTGVHDASINETLGPYVASACRIDGCSSSLCVDKDAPEVVTTCEWKKEYACYTLARCEVQPSGSCGWTPTLKLNRCLQ